MKRTTRWICLFLVLSLLIAIPVQASTEAELRANDYFSSAEASLVVATSSTIQIWFDVNAISMMDELGASVIRVYRSADGDNWSVARTFSRSNYSVMIKENAMIYSNYVTYTGAWSGYYYRASVTLYAKNSAGNATRAIYTGIIQM